MDLENFTKPIKMNKYPTTECYFQTNSSRVFVNSANPFNSVGSSRGKGWTDDSKKRNNDEIIDLFDNSVKTPYTATSNGLYRDVRQDCDTHVGSFINENDERDDEQSSDKNISQPTFNLSTRPFDTPYTRSIPKTPSNKQQVRFEEQNNNQRENEDKTTYCRPLHNMYNNEFVFKTMRRNARLHRIVRRLVIERQKEKQKEAWNNYINDLKSKHGYDNDQNGTNQYAINEPNLPDFIDDYYNRSKYQQSYFCQDLLRDLYSDYNTSNDCYCEYPRNYYPLQPPRPYYASDQYCYPTASQGRLMMLEQERKNSLLTSQPSKNYQGYPDKDLSRIGKRHLNCIRSKQNLYDCYKKKSSIVHSPCDQLVDEAVQTEVSLVLMREEAIQAQAAKRDAFQQRLQQVTSHVERLNRKILVQTEDQPESKIRPLETIEEKLNTLIKSVDSFISEMRTKKLARNDNKPASSNEIKKSNVKKLSYLSNVILSKSKSDTVHQTPNTFGSQKTDQILFTTVIPTSRNVAITEIGTHMSRHKHTDIDKIDKIIQEEMEKSEKIKHDIEELLQTRAQRQCSVQIAIDIPTKEISTEVTSSLSKTFRTAQNSENEIRIEEITSPESRESGELMAKSTRMTIAVNTDPLGLLALLRVSTETIKQLLSYMPRLNYNSYLQLLQVPQRACITHYVCSICGASFSHPSHLSDHIQKHNLGRTRDCCICRHVIEMQRDHIGLFSCKYCGHRFARAYCCELHQQTCAKRLGRTHEPSSSLMYLR
ncbi:uncharacterized protein LOC142979942 [Anticarsia gemmatalis]|uniref:uncharacterized protein LOC142979942 n=1 Tax=Anticarsia gemmatalis TaxID=129554 RepID=UPI003F772692